MTIQAVTVTQTKMTKNMNVNFVANSFYFGADLWLAATQAPEQSNGNMTVSLYDMNSGSPVLLAKATLKAQEAQTAPIMVLGVGTLGDNGSTSSQINYLVPDNRALKAEIEISGDYPSGNIFHSGLSFPLLNGFIGFGGAGHLSYQFVGVMSTIA